jgi:hypothetical protein
MTTSSYGDYEPGLEGIVAVQGDIKHCDEAMRAPEYLCGTGSASPLLADVLT